MPSAITFPWFKPSSRSVESFSASRCVMYGGRTLQHCLARNLPEDALAQRLLRHAPRIERSERPDDIRHTSFTTHMRRSNGRVVEDSVNVGQIELLNV